MTRPPEAALVDASVWCAAANRDERWHEESVALLHGAGAVFALDLTLYEVANVAVRSWRAPYAVPDLLELISGTCAAPLAIITPRRARQAAQVADEHTISVYDAAYVTVAAELGCTLVSCDVRDLVSKGLAILPG